MIYHRVCGRVALVATEHPAAPSHGRVAVLCDLYHLPFTIFDLRLHLAIYRFYDLNLKPETQNLNGPPAPADGPFAWLCHALAYARRRRSASPARPTSISIALVGSGTELTQAFFVPATSVTESLNVKDSEPVAVSLSPDDATADEV